MNQMVFSLMPLVLLPLVILAFVFWIMMLVDCIKNNRLTSDERIVWALVIIFLHGLGALVYYFAGREGT